MLLAITATLPTFVPAALAQTTEQIGEAAQATIKELNLQTRLPGRSQPIPPPKGDPNALPDLQKWNGPSAPPSTMFWIILGTIVVAVVAFVLYQMRDTFKWTPKGRENTSAPARDSDKDEDDEINLSLTADELGRQGRYVEAIHWLLLSALAEIRERLGIRFPDFLTSREILRRANIPAKGKTLLKDIILRVELSYFGDYPASEQDFAACRNNFELLLAELRAQPEKSVLTS
jgi:hypothetical protein